jgi:hypothetical protein
MVPSNTEGLIAYYLNNAAEARKCLFGQRPEGGFWRRKGNGDCSTRLCWQQNMAAARRLIKTHREA